MGRIRWLGPTGLMVLMLCLAGAHAFFPGAQLLSGFAKSFSSGSSGSSISESHSGSTCQGKPGQPVAAAESHDKTQLQMSESGSVVQASPAISPQLEEMKAKFPEAEVQELNRFLTKSGRVEKAVQTYQRCLDWRAETLPITDEAVDGVAHWMWFHGKAKDSTDILFLQGAKYDPDSASAEQYVLHTAKLMTTIPATSDQKLTVLVDVRAYDEFPSPSASRLMGYVRKIAPLMNDCFPGRLKALVLYPVPSAAATIWAVTKTFLSKSTASKVTLLPGSDTAGSPVPAELWNYVDREQLSPEVQDYHMYPE